ncbi:MAG: flavodoxin, partial [Candidatus Brocadiae bacterium]|nr:flavodoxin [Candidatus Brocadiia bacterium]
MGGKRCLVVYYSRSGTTRKAAEAIAGLLGCDIEEILDRKDRSGVTGYLVSLKDSALRKPAEIEPVRRDPADYDLVVIGTP